MRLQRLVARGFRNLADLDCELPAEGLALLGANGQGKTNLLEAIAYPVLFRSFRGAADQDVAGAGREGFHVGVTAAGDCQVNVSATWPGNTPDTALTLEFEPDGLESRSETRWSSGGSLDEVITFSWK